ncbi:hypothetical protein ABZY83_05720 [Streptomyces virginiae]|uniref:hypothetical protein n=1 Tax=Streptomyces TaxID=1883 RepID=UPI0004C8AD79|nr:MULTISPECIES: hypothetical protein [unclassified Streptomyces]KJY22671.1 hypothetical protein VR43_05100 [Streptomyces sp. NRRL S-104]KOU66183.1 hypothetical protein ADK96_14365 [Streptomyces sp. IGB124]KOU74777.1 hypothetical protein ADK61_18800 [Streptomyces sp. XY66]KOU88959.1 hypothetical protein ADK93_11320 [Streptomyces sp. XY58]KOV11355.1 hypothetical protein ADK89_04345 [Streptomyces sp. XY37]
MGEGEVHVFSVLNGSEFPPAEEMRHEASAGDDRTVRALLGRLLMRPPDEVRLTRDDLGRQRWDAGPFGLAVCRDDGGLLVALARGLSVALSTVTVPGSVEAEALLPFSRTERAFAGEAAAGRRPLVLARMWARKEAALRLAGRGAFALAAEVDVLAAGPDGRVALPASGPWGAGGVAYVRDLPDGAGTVAAVAASAPVRRAVFRRLRCPEPATA